MYRRILTSILAIGVALALSATNAAAGNADNNRQPRRPDVILYKWNVDMSPQQREALGQLILAYDMRLERKIVDNTVLRVKAFRTAGRTEEDLATELMASGAVEWAQPDYVEQAVATPNDPYYPSQWQHVNIRSASAWDYTVGSEQVIVAICDTGVDLNHADLKSQLVLPGWNTYLNTTNCMDTHGHGTMVAGFAGATGNNGTGVVGAAWNVRILPIRITYADGSGSAYVGDMAEAIAYGANNGAKVINVSFSGYYNSAIIAAANDARLKGALVVMAAGNDGLDISGYADPASIVLVGASDSQNARASFSNYGTPIDVFAPGLNVWSTILGGYYGYGSGTSFSSPITAGLAALIYSLNPSFSPASVEDLIKSTCLDLGATGEDSVYGFGLIQADGAVAKAYSSLGNLPPVAVAAADRTSGNIPLPVAFSGSASYDPNGSIISYAWNFGDGSAVAYGVTTAHTYTKAGTFTTSLVVTDNLGATATNSVKITATDPFVLTAPSVLTAKASLRTVTLNWLDNSSNETGFYIERGLRSKTGVVYARVGAVAANVRTYNDTVPAAGTYYFRVQAYRTDGTTSIVSPYSNAVSVKVR
jgi:thermitase